MLDPIQMAMQNIYFRIQPEILQIAFNSQQRRMTIDECIRQDVIVNRIMSDINLHGGKRTNIVLREQYAKFCPPPIAFSVYAVGNYAIYQIPPQDRENRNIASIIGLRYPYTMNTYTMSPAPFMNQQLGSTMGSLASLSLNSHTYANVATVPNVYQIQGDMIKLDPPQISHIDWILECRLEWDLNFTSMDPNAIKAFVNLVYIATRGYIYTNLVINADKTYIYGGQELNIIKEIIAEGKDYLDRYDEALNNFLGATLIGREEVAELIAYMF